MKKISPFMIALLIFTSLTLVSLENSRAVGDTGTISGNVFNDDDGDWFITVSTDSNGVLDTADNGGFDNIAIIVVDSEGPDVAHTDSNGDWSMEVSTLTDVAVQAPVFDINNLPSHYEATTTLTRTVTPVADEDTPVDPFGYGPSY